MYTGTTICNEELELPIRRRMGEAPDKQENGAKSIPSLVECLVTLGLNLRATLAFYISTLSNQGKGLGLTLDAYLLGHAFFQIRSSQMKRVQGRQSTKFGWDGTSKVIHFK